MVYMKYILSKTGLFPQWEPKIEDVLYAAGQVHDIKTIITPYGDGYYYIIPLCHDNSYLRNLLRLFRANGIFLRPHKSHKYNSWVFRVPNHGQTFVRDVARVNKDAEKFKDVLVERGIDMPRESVIKMVEKLKQQQM